MSCCSSSTGPLCHLGSCRLNSDFYIIGCSDCCRFSVIKSPGKTGFLLRVCHSTATTLCLLCLLSDLNRILFGKVIADQLHLDAFKPFLLELQLPVWIVTATPVVYFNVVRRLENPVTSQPSTLLVTVGQADGFAKSCRTQSSMAAVKHSKSSTLSFWYVPRLALPFFVSCDMNCRIAFTTPLRRFVGPDEGGKPSYRIETEKKPNG